MSRFRMLVLDIDGTTLRRNGTIAPCDRRAVRALQERGIKVTIATGRLFSGTKPIAQKLGIRGTVGCMNGSELVDVDTSRRAEGRYLCEQSTKRARKAIRSYGLNPFVFTSDHLHYDVAGEPYLAFMRSWTETFVRHEAILDTGPWEGRGNVLAVAGIGRPTAIRLASESIQGELPDNVETITFRSSKNPVWYLKLRDRRNDKGTALEAIGRENNITPQESVSIGDWLNDLPMLANAGRSFAMGQAHPLVKESATDVCESTSQLGGAIAEVARKVWGIEV